MMHEPETETKSDSQGIGIGTFRFLKGKSYLTTGATGFLAKETPEIGKIFVLVKCEDQEFANKRLSDEIISSDLFKLLKQMHGSSYEAFMKSKLIPVVGDIGEDNVGIESQIACKISDEIDVIISCAGRTTFDDRYDSALVVNALGPGRLLNSSLIILDYGKDFISDMWGDYHSSCDIIPVDMVANATIAAMAKHGCGVSELKAYNLMDFSRQHLRDSPLIETVTELECMKFHSSLEYFTSSVSNRIAQQEGEMNTRRGESHTMLSMKGKRKLKYLVSLARTYQPYTFFQAREITSLRLVLLLSKKQFRLLTHICYRSYQRRRERCLSLMAGWCIDWKDYIVNVHLPGLKRELFHE
ncbi:hypothetical protein Bca4012_021577 [Brassica carinata]|uniref:Fatty acyl-CoA reductase n=1 Tax=Brassica carinata TaxID=52824 RepID=A0A8X7TXF0_BRACI|nr:hypothetical protein Bca52824_077594 [Brassica carinata]